MDPLQPLPLWLPAAWVVLAALVALAEPEGRRLEALLTLLAVTLPALLAAILWP